MITTTATHLLPARHIRNAFKETVRASLARDPMFREQGSLLQGPAILAIEKNGTGISRGQEKAQEKEIAAEAAPTIEKNGTGIEKNGTGITWGAVS